MLLKNASPEFKKIFLLEFTRQLIRHHSGIEIYELENIVKDEKKQEKERIKKIIHERKRVHKIETPLRFKPLPTTRRVHPRILRIPQTRLPRHLNYLRPVPKNIELDLEKLTPLVKDLAVKVIECDGPDRNIVVITDMRKQTSIVLTKEEIDQIIQKFSEQSKIPVSKGVVNIVLGKLELSAIVEETGSKFIIKKIAPRIRLR
jgi:hypothetical protein